MRIKKLQWIFLLAIFLLPFQTQLIYRIIAMPEGVSEYGKFAFFATEMLIAAAFVFSRRDSEKPAKEIQKTLRGFYLFIAAGFLSLTFTHFYSVSLLSMGHLITAGMLFLMLCDERTKLRPVLYAFVLGLIAPCILGWYQYLHGFSPASTLFGLAEKRVDTQGVAVVATNMFRSLRAYGTFPHPNIFGGYLAIAIVVLVFLAYYRSLSPFEALPTGRQGESRREGLRCAWLHSPLIILFASTFILTFSRSAWLALAIAILSPFAIVLLPCKGEAGRGLAARCFNSIRISLHNPAIQLALFGLATIIISTFIFHSRIFARFDATQHVEAISIEERTTQYATFPNVFRLNPVFGVGAGAYTFALESISKGQSVWNYQPIHNTFLLILAEFGIVGFLAFAYWMFELARLLFSRRASIGGRFAIVLAIELCVLAAFDHYLFSFWSGLVLAAFALGVCVRMGSEKRGGGM